MLADLQRVLLTACLQREPASWLSAYLGRGDARLAATEVALLRQLVQEPTASDGMRLTRLIVQKLRLERLLRGDAAAAAAFAADPVQFTASFRRYLDAVPPGAVFPREEAAAFRAFTDGPTEG